jgi:hypothetical protein
MTVFQVYNCGNITVVICGEGGREYKKFEYFSIRELTTSELIHSHVLFRGYFIPHEWIVDTWVDLTGFKIVNIRLLQGDPKRMAGYVSKYVTKSHLRYGWSKYWVFPRFALVWQAVKRYTDYNMPLAIQIFDKILESGWLYWDRKLLREFLQSGDFTRQKGLEELSGKDHPKIDNGKTIKND